MKHVGPALALVLVTGLTGCTSSTSEDPGVEGPVFSEVACPDDVEVLVVPAHRCGFVTPDPGEPTRIFVTVVEPPTPSDAAPVLETGVDLGMTPTYGGLAPIAQRTGRRLVIVDLPGTGHSLPSLDCPEVEALDDATAHQRPDLLVEAVEACRARLDRDGADVAALTPSRLGESLVAVMEALGEPRWVVMGHGTTAEAGRQVALSHPAHVEALVVDSLVADPGLPVEPLISEVAELCRAEPACLRRHGDPEQRWQQARRSLADRPLQVAVPGTSVTIDAATLERGVRWLTGPTEGAARLPEFLHEVATRHVGPELELFAATLSAAPPLCVGFVPKCETDQRLVIGATLSAQCPTAADLPAWQSVCRAWGVPAVSGAATPVVGVPTLALSGALDPFATPALVQKQLDELLPDAFRLELASGGHNVLGVECTRDIRNAWLASDLSQGPPVEPCLTAPPMFE